MSALSTFDRVLDELRLRPRRWTITGVAGFIGSNLLERLLVLGQEVVGIDDFSTGSPRNLEEAIGRSGRSGSFEFIEASILDRLAVERAIGGSQVVLHQAALGSVPRSIANPEATNETNVSGFLRVMSAARGAGVERVVYASSSSVYGDDPSLPKREDRLGTPLSPYAVTKRANELYAAAFASSYGLESVGLRYFNVFGRRQDPSGAYAAVIPRWIDALMRSESCTINGDGTISRDFCYVENVVQANLLGAILPQSSAHVVYNVACGERVTLLEMFSMIRDGLARLGFPVSGAIPAFGPPRPGDICHSQADIGRIAAALGYTPTHDPSAGLEETLRWYAERRGGTR